MKIESNLDILLGDDFCYKRYPADFVFECRLRRDSIPLLITDPSSILKKVKVPRFFWLRTMGHVLVTDGLLVFETFPPQNTNNPPIDVVVARTVFQLDGDMLIKIDKNILTRRNGLKMFEAHCRWTAWCLEKQLKSAHRLFEALSYARWGFLALVLLLLSAKFPTLDIWRVNVMLIVYGVALSVLAWLAWELVSKVVTLFFMRRLT